MEQNLDAKLSRVESTINVMKTNLRLPENEVIEKVAEATNLHTLANIYIQEEEPEIKDGIWIQVDKAACPYDTVKIDKDILLSGRWRYDLAAEKPVHTTSNSGAMCSIGNMAYSCSSSNSGYGASLAIAEYKLDTLPVVATRVYSNSSQSVCSPSNGTKPFTDGTYIYVPDGGKNGIGLHRYDPVSKTVTFVSMAVSGWGTGGSTGAYLENGVYSVYDNSLYAFSPWSKKVARRSLDTGEITSMSSPGAVTQAIPFNNRLLCFISGSPYVKWLNLDNNKVESVTTGNLTTKSWTDASFIDMGNCIYAVFKLNEVYKIDKTTLEYVDISDEFGSGAQDDVDVKGIAQYGSTIVALQSNQALPMDTTVAEYDSNSIVIMQSPITSTEKRTALWTYPNLDGRLCQSFYDVYYYNKESGYYFDPPTYYGDGTKWIKFKN